MTHSFLDPRYAVTWGYLHGEKPAYFRAQHSRNPRHRRHLTSHYVLWSVTSGLPRARCVWTGTPLVETGRLFYWRFSLAMVFSAYIMIRIHKGVIWLLVATVAEVLPAVSGRAHVPLFSAYCDIMSQVFLCLNYNGKFLSILSTNNR